MTEPTLGSLHQKIAALKEEIAILRKADLERAEREKQFVDLQTELQHRVRNILAIIRAVTRRTAATAGARDLEEYSAHLVGRIDALARVQSILIRNGHRAVELEELVRDELLYQSAGAEIVVDGPSVLLRNKAAEALGLAFHELATNAVKYGSLRDRRGALTVRWHTQRDSAGPASSEPVILLEWIESGHPTDGRILYNGSASDHVGFGRDWIEQGLPYALGARTEIELRPDGLRCMIAVPVVHTQPGTHADDPESPLHLAGRTT